MQVLMNLMRNFTKFLDSKQPSLPRADLRATTNRQIESAKNPENKDELFGLYSSVLDGSSDGE